MASLKPQGRREAICPDSGNIMTLINRKFLQRQDSNCEIHKLEKPINVRGVGGRLVPSDCYANIRIHLPAKLHGSEVMAVVPCEAHLVDYLPANLLLGTDVMTPYGLDISHSNLTMTIHGC